MKVGVQMVFQSCRHGPDVADGQVVAEEVHLTRGVVDLEHVEPLLASVAGETAAVPPLHGVVVP